MTRIQKIKNFVSNHADEIVAGTMFTAVAALTVAVTIKAIKDQNRLNEWIQEQYRAGNVVHQLIDGSYIAVKYTTND